MMIIFVLTFLLGLLAGSMLIRWCIDKGWTRYRPR